MSGNGWTPLSPDEVASWFADKRSGWKPSPLQCAAIGGQLDSFFMPARWKRPPATNRIPTRRDTDAVKHAKALIRSVSLIISDLKAIAEFRENRMAQDKGADPNYISIELLGEMTATITICLPILQNQKKPGINYKWREAARYTFVVISDAFKSDYTARPMSISSESHIAGVIKTVLRRAGLGEKETSAIADACTDRKLSHMFARQVRTYEVSRKASPT